MAAANRQEGLRSPCAPTAVWFSCWKSAYMSRMILPVERSVRLSRAVLEGVIERRASAGTDGATQRMHDQASRQRACASGEGGRKGCGLSARWPSSELVNSIAYPRTKPGTRHALTLLTASTLLTTSWKLCLPHFADGVDGDDGDDGDDGAVNESPLGDASAHGIDFSDVVGSDVGAGAVFGRCAAALGERPVTAVAEGGRAAL